MLKFGSYVIDHFASPHRAAPVTFSNGTHAVTLTDADQIGDFFDDIEALCDLHNDDMNAVCAALWHEMVTINEVGAA